MARCCCDAWRAPRGFSLDNLAPDQIEKIEIVRTATAEFSMQAIAGTINIVLKKLVAKPQRDLRMNGGGPALDLRASVNRNWSHVDKLVSRANVAACAGPP